MGISIIDSIAHFFAIFGICFRDYYENTWIKREFLLCVLKYCKQKKILFVTPDFNKINPYFIQIFEDEMRNFEYFIEDVSDNISPELLLKENDILNKVNIKNPVF